MHTQARTSILASIGLLLVSAAGLASAQQTQKKSEVEFLPVEPQAAEPSPRRPGPYEISLSLETGRQQAVVKGNNEVYRSHLNYGDGLRLFDFNFRAKGGNESFFSDFYVQGSGWGGDPSNWLGFGASKEQWFDFRARYRRSDYFWVFPGFARNEHRSDRERRLQRYELTLLPKRPLHFRLGYTRNSSFGLDLTTFQFDRDAFVLSEPIRQTHDEYRAGWEWSTPQWGLFFDQGFRFFRNDRFLFLSEALNPGNIPDDLSFLTETQREYPIRGRIHFTRFIVVGRPHSTFDFTARISYSDNEIDATRFETNAGETFGQSFQFTFNTAAGAARSNTVGDGGLTWRPVPGLTISNSFRFNQFNISGVERTESQRFFPSLGSSFFSEDNSHKILEVDSYSNRFEGRYDFAHWLGVRAGFLYGHRVLQLVEFEAGLPGDMESVGLKARSFLLGFLLRPQRTMTVFFDLERGNHTGVFTRLSPADIDRIRIRSRWQPIRGVKFNASWFLFDNSNSDLRAPLDSDGRHNSRNRGTSIDFQLTRFPRGYLNLGYSRNDITAVTSVLFFTDSTLQAGEAVYVANDNYAYVDFGGRLVGTLHVDAGYRVVTNTGTFPPSDPVGACDPFVPGVCDNLTGLEPLGINFGGLNYHQPHAALRFVLNGNISFKAGWRWYGYNVKQGTASDYKAHLITTSLLLRF